MSSGVKFLFDTDFKEVDASGAPVDAAQERAEAFSEEELQAARMAGREEGYQAGRAEALGELEAASSAALQAIAGAVTQICQAQEQRWAQAASLSILVARKIADAAIEAAPIAEIEATIESCLAELREEPRAVIRVAESLVEVLAGRLSDISARHGLTADIAVLGDDSLAMGDCRVEWADGGAERLTAHTESAIAEIVQRHLGAVSHQLPDPTDPASNGE